METAPLVRLVYVKGTWSTGVQRQLRKTNVMTGTGLGISDGVLKQKIIITFPFCFWYFYSILIIKKKKKSDNKEKNVSIQFKHIKQQENINIIKIDVFNLILLIKICHQAQYNYFNQQVIQFSVH